MRRCDFEVQIELHPPGHLTLERDQASHAARRGRVGWMLSYGYRHHGNSKEMGFQTHSLFPSANYSHSETCTHFVHVALHTVHFNVSPLAFSTVCEGQSEPFHFTHQSERYQCFNCLIVPENSMNFTGLNLHLTRRIQRAHGENRPFQVILIHCTQ